MPANLTPQYLKAEEAYRQASTPEEKLRCLEEMLRLIPKHKGTEHMQGDIKRRIAQLRKAEHKRHGSRTTLYLVEKEGAGQIALLGAPNVGKSQLLVRLTNARSEVAPYPFTTQLPIPGMMPYKDVKIQLVDMPPITQEFMHPWQADLVRRADGALLIVDLSKDDSLEQAEAIIQRLEKVRIKLISAESDPPLPGDGEFDPTVYRRTILVGNKCDLKGAAERASVLRELYVGRLPLFQISADSGAGLEELREAIFRLLRVIRVYTKRPGHPPDMNEPFVLPIGSTVLQLAEHVHKEIAAGLKSARVWGSAKFGGQYVPRDHVLQDGDVVELHE